MANAVRARTSPARKVMRDTRNDSKNDARRIGVTSRRFRILRWRYSAIPKPIDQRLVPIRFMPSNPGNRKSM